ncbi:hypothetical protein [Enterovirga rhinocerotis]|uniref:Uncharacterized protein n=1 Tax=Enterovirga rhinocerotis TaxID=1339210 RepID=A0A4R7BZL3_9HYPH|nr:hypothetical protein [Enterovirga rhinocerotis]TDR89546.1 hypothetical protein EV668_2376 [Enterovirga rhinocerotis]
MSKRKKAKAEDARVRDLALDLEILLTWIKLTPAEQKEVLRRIETGQPLAEG